MFLGTATLSNNQKSIDGSACLTPETITLHPYY
jgi:hypothetical protein